MEGPVAAFDRVAETAECARNRLCENPKIDQVAMRRVLDRPEPREERRIYEAPYPQEPVPHALLNGVHANRVIEAFQPNFTEISKRKPFTHAKFGDDVGNERLFGVGMRAKTRC